MRDRTGLALWHDYTKGNVTDYSGNGNDGTLTNSEGFIKSTNGWGYKPQATNGYVSVADSSELQLTECALAIYADFKSLDSTNRRLLSKRDGGGTNFELYAASTSITFFSNGVGSVFTLASADYLIGKKTLIITQASGAAKPKLYIDGVFHSEGTLNVTMTTDDAPLIIGNFYASGFPVNFPINSVAIYNVEKTAAETAAIHKDISTLFTVNTGTRGGYTGPSVDPDDPNAVSGWNMEKNSGKVMDNVGNNHGTPSGGLTQVRTPWGEPALQFPNGGTGQISCGVATDLGFTSELFGGYLWVSHDAFTGNNYYINRGATSTDGYEFYTNSSGLMVLRHNQAGATQAALGSTLTANKWYLLSWFSDSDKLRLYVNGASVSSSTDRVNPVYNAARVFYLGSNGGAGSYLDGIMTKPVIGIFSSQAEYENWLTTEYNRVANKVLYRQDFEGAAVMQSAIGSGTLPGTDVEVVSGTHKISYDATLGKKCIECVTAGVVAIPVPQGNAAFGTFESYFNKTDAGVMNFYYISDSKDISVANGVRITLTASEVVGLQRITAGGTTTRMTTATSEFTASAWHKLSVETSTESSHLTKIDDTSVTATVGTNPIVDSAHTSSQYIVWDMDAGDKVGGEILKKFGVAI